MVNINLDKLKEMGSQLVDSVKSGVESVTQTTKKNPMLPSEINARIEEIQAHLKALQDAQFAQQKAADTLFNSISAFSREAIALCEKTCCPEEKADAKAENPSHEEAKK